MFISMTLVTCLLGVVHSQPPDKLSSIHIIKTRSIDLNNAHGLSIETRLPKTIEPTGYKLDLEPYLEDGVFKGHVSINVTWLEDTDEITLHCAHELVITDYEVWAHVPEKSKEMKEIRVISLEKDPKHPRATLKLNQLVAKSSIGRLDFTFNGEMETVTTEALFKTSYMEQEEERIVVATQLRSNNARRLFPCFDEPAFKTTFELSVVRPRNMIALSNMPVARTENITDEPNAVWDHFEKTPRMSTFTLGLVIANLKLMSTATVEGVELRVWCRPEFEETLAGVNEKAAKIFKEISRFWQVSLPIRRLDIVALPNYQGVKPADNWGLIVFRESDLSGRGNYLLAQEISYQWLGNYATPAWWSDAHLNKALVGYLTAEITIKIDNGVEMEGKWPMIVLYPLFYELSRRYPHSRITGMKQESTSSKIELLFRMFNYTIAPDTFKKGLRSFMENYHYKTFKGDDIWNALNVAAQEEGMIPDEFDIKTAANSWIKKDRLPVVTAHRNYDSNSLVVQQKVFLRERPHDVPDADKMTWWIPLVLVQQKTLDFSNTIPTEWMCDAKSITLHKMPSKDEFIIINPEEIAPFPVNYDEHNWNLLLKYLQSKDRTKIPELTRAKLIHDAWNLAYAGELSFATALNMTLFLKDERNPLVWDPVFTMIDHVGRHLCQCIQGKFNAFVRTLLTPLYKELAENQKEDEESWCKTLRSSANFFLCRAGYKPCIKEAQKQYSKWTQAQNPDEGNPISDVYFCPVFKWGTKEEWEFGLHRVINFPSSRRRSERTYLLKTLAGCPRDEYKIVRLLNVTILENNGNFTETDLFLIFSMLTGSSEGYTALFNFLDKNWDFLRERYITKTNLWDNLITSATSQFTTQDALELVTNLYVAHQNEFGSAEHIIGKSIKNIREEVVWTAENLPVIDKWFDEYLANNQIDENV